MNTLNKTQPVFDDQLEIVDETANEAVSDPDCQKEESKPSEGQQEAQKEDRDVELKQINKLVKKADQSGGNSDDGQLLDLITKTLTTGASSAGTLDPTTLRPQVITPSRSRVWLPQLVSNVEMRSTDMDIPVYSDSSADPISNTAEDATIPLSDPIGVSSVKIQTRPFTSLAKVSRMLQATAAAQGISPDVLSAIQDALVSRLQAKLQGLLLSADDATNGQYGLLSLADATPDSDIKASIATNATTKDSITYDDLFSVITDHPSAHLNGSIWIMDADTIKLITKLGTGQAGNHAFMPNQGSSSPGGANRGTLFGYPVYSSGSVIGKTRTFSTIAASKAGLIFFVQPADALMVGRLAGVQVEVDNSRYFDENNTAVRLIAYIGVNLRVKSAISVFGFRATT